MLILAQPGSTWEDTWVLKMSNEYSGDAPFPIDNESLKKGLQSKFTDLILQVALVG